MGVGVRAQLGAVLVLTLTAWLADAVPTANSNRPDILPTDCGRRLVRPDEARRPFIVGPGNTTAYYGKYPWQARLVMYDANVKGYVHHCGGIIVSQEHVVTAAHCVIEVAPRRLLVRVGDLRFDDRELFEQEFAVASYHVHSRFGTAAGLRHDVALLRLRRRVGPGIEFGRYVQPACLPAAGTRVYQDRFLPGAMFCSGPTGGGADSCEGDSGGPLEPRGAGCGKTSFSPPAQLGASFVKNAANFPWMAAISERQKGGRDIVVCGGAVISDRWVLTGGTCARDGRQLSARLVMYDANVKGYVHHCGGIIVSQEHVVTAAHCVVEVAPRRLLVRVGDLRFDDRELFEQEFAVASYHVHSRFGTAAGLRHDVALLRLRRRVGAGITLGRYVQPACLPAAGTKYETFLPCEMSGWGRIADLAPISEVLRGVSVPLVSDAFCGAPEVYQDRFLPGAIGRFVAYGVVSSGDPLGCGRRPGLYTKLSAYTAWLLRRLELDQEEDAAPSTTEPRGAGCGKTSFSPPAQLGASFVKNAANFPWMAAISERQKGGRDIVVCGGAVISDRWVLTGATCTRDGRQLSVRFGDLDLQDTSDDNPNAPPFELDIIKVARHPQFSPPEKRAQDIALLKTVSKISFSST
ncbi:transmembrane protease serine 9-like, partial [Pollicipes pollicipes]|uniref:transmembrane protease serine 9-like n=1 Tax=Pollicipes pollicipes TaxID=41117 RepID=UPI0018858F89